MTGGGGLSVASARKRKGGGGPTCILLRLRRDTELLSQRVLVSPGDLSLQRAQLANATDRPTSGITASLVICILAGPLLPLPCLSSVLRIVSCNGGWELSKPRKRRESLPSCRVFV